MRTARIVSLVLSLAILAIPAIADTPMTGQDTLQVGIELADGSAYLKHPLRVRLVFRNTAEEPVTLPATAFAGETFEVTDDSGTRLAPKRVTDATLGDALPIDGYATVERVVDLTPWYPAVPGKRRDWSIVWSADGRSSGPLAVRIIRPYDPARDREAIVDTDMGRMRWELLGEQAPRHVKRFVDLAREGFYESRPIYKVVPGVIAETGDPAGDGTEGWKSLMHPEIATDLDMRLGMVGFQRQEGSSMTSDRVLFITLSQADHMAGKQTIFARVIDGLGIIAKLNVAANTGDTGLKNAFRLEHPVTFQRIRIK